MTRSGKIKTALLVTGVYGVLSGVIRGLSLIFGFDENCLSSGSPLLSRLVPWLMLLGAAVAGVWYLLLKKTLKTVPRVNNAGWSISVAAGLFFLIASALRMASAFSHFNMLSVVIALLLFASAFCLPMAAISARGRKERGAGVRFGALVPVGAVCAETVELYRTVTRMPDGLYYCSDVLACACCGLLLFAVCGVVFRRAGAQKVCGYSLLWFAVGMPDMIGRAMALLAGKSAGLNLIYNSAARQGQVVTYGGVCTLDATLVFMFAAATAAAISVCIGICARPKSPAGHED